MFGLNPTYTILFWEIGPIFWALLEVQADSKQSSDLRKKPEGEGWAVLLMIEVLHHLIYICIEVYYTARIPILHMTDTHTTELHPHHPPRQTRPLGLLLALLALALLALQAVLPEA